MVELCNNTLPELIEGHGDIPLTWCHSLVVLQIIIPYLDRINDDDVDYIMGKEGRYTWYERLSERPIQLKSGEIGTTGKNIKNKNLKIVQKLKRISFIRFAVKLVKKLTGKS